MSIEQYLMYIIVTSGVCLGLRAASESGMILEPIRNLLDRILPDWLYKPVLGCITCMSSFWGIVTVLSFSGVSGIAYIPSVILTCAFLNSYLWNKYNLYR